jgi:hypothetical protein
MSRLFQSLARIGRDGATLSRALLTGPRGSGGYVKPVLLEQARQSNLVATSMLQIEREFGLFRYHGWRGYLQDRLMGTMRRRLFPSSQDENLNPTTSESSDGGLSPDVGAKVAFMITSSMKQELKDNLGYDADQIKKMTPQQASIVLFHNVSPEAYKERLPILEAEFAREQEEKQRQQEQSRVLELQKEQEEERKRFETFTPPQTSTVTLSATPSIISGGTSLENTTASNPLVLSDAKEGTKLPGGSIPYVPKEYIESEETTLRYMGSADELPLKFRDRESGFSEIWYEVVEINPNGERLRVGLYQEKDEALLGLETREMIRDKRLERAAATEPRNTFDLREISKEEAYAGN